MRIAEILNEGGAAIKGSSPVSPAEFKQVMAKLHKLLPTLNFHPFGSAGLKPLSGDVDVMVEVDDTTEHFDAKDVKAAKDAMMNYFKSKGLESNKSGVSVHVGVPVGDKIAQVDIMFVNNAEQIAKLHRHDYSEDPQLKGSAVAPMIADLVKATDPDYKMSPWKGVVSRETGELITADKDEIARIVFGPEFTANDLRNPPAILAAAKKAGKEWVFDESN